MAGRRRNGGALLIAAFLVGGLAGATPSVAGGLAVNEVASGVFVHRGVHELASADNAGDIANIGFIVGEQAVAVIDAGGSPRVGAALREAVRRVTRLPIRYLILTHGHPDHIFGWSAFATDGPEIVGHNKLPRALALRGGHYVRNFSRILGDGAGALKLPTINLTVSDRLELDLGGRVLVLRAHNTAHSDSDLSVYDSRTGTLWLSDLLVRERIPVVDGSIKGWRTVMGEVAAIGAERVVPGHGSVSDDWPGAQAGQHRYLEVIAREIRIVLNANGTIESAVATVGEVERPHWHLFDEYNKRNVTASFVELEWE